MGICCFVDESTDVTATGNKFLLRRSHAVAVDDSAFCRLVLRVLADREPTVKARLRMADGSEGAVIYVMNSSEVYLGTEADVQALISDECQQSVARRRVNLK